jgi:DNA-binding response OmpR family regulator
VLVVEDDARLSAVLDQALTEAGHLVTTANDGAAGFELATLEPFDTVLLDWMLPGLDGPTICRRLRERGVRTPVLMLTARGEVEDRVEALDAYADDHLTKPFALDELLARLRALHRRGETMTLPVIELGDLRIDAERRQVHRGRTPIVLTAREFDVLHLLAQRAGRVVSRQQILDDVWDGETDLRSNDIDVHVAGLRHKIDKPFGRVGIETVRGAGYRLAENGG